VKQKLFAVFQSVGVLVLITYTYWHVRERPWTLMSTAGLALAVPSFALGLLARIQLGRSFAVRAFAKELVTHGVYSRIRNPIYLFGTLFITGLILLIGKPALLLLMALVVPLQVIRAHKEARVLENKFGEAYRAYRSRTWF
jgi:protein-S-isoprenylcysteine O-methyltransferase Ste14